MTQGAPDVRGHWPKLANRRLDAVVLQEFWYQGTLEDEAIVCWLHADQRWYRIFFDLGVAHCLASSDPPQVELSPDDLCICKFKDISPTLGLGTTKVRRMMLNHSSAALSLTLEFDNGIQLQLHHTHLGTEPKLSTCD